MPATERERNLDRFLTFVDAIVAIAITLLVLPLVDIGQEKTAGVSAADLLDEHTGEIVSFFLSFVVIAMLWFAQHHLMSSVVVEDRLLTRCLMGWVMTIVVLPFPTALVAAPGDDDLTKVLYIGTMALSSLFLAAAAWHVARTPAIRDGGDPPDPVGSLITAATMVLALLISLAVPDASYWPLLLLVVSGRVSAFLGSRRRAARAG